MAVRPQYYDVDPCVISTVQEKVRRTKRCYRLTDDEADELRQELLLIALEKASLFNPELSKWETYIDRILKNRIKYFLRSLDAEKNRQEKFLLLSECDGECNSEIIAQMEGNYFGISSNLMKSEDSGTDNINKRIDIETVMAKLKPIQKKMCCLLMMGYSLSDVSRILKLPRYLMDLHLKKVRKAFIFGGL
jgi:RNA polymerase sigma factor (sigma-70 family)